MRKLIVAQFLTLDGVMESPEKWNGQYQQDEELTADILNDFSACDALVVGRTTYQFLAERWPARTGVMADYFNTLPKYVVSATLQKATWSNSTIIKSNVGEAINKLKAQSGKNIRVLGSHQLVQELMRKALVDEYKLYVYPLTLGTGRRLFEEGEAGQALKLVSTKSFASGVMAAVYQVSTRNQ